MSRQVVGTITFADGMFAECFKSLGLWNEATSDIGDFSSVWQF
ncbi:MAG: hypothetical protein U0996_25540 [Planctomycetaceae bacterium]